MCFLKGLTCWYALMLTFFWVVILQIDNWKSYHSGGEILSPITMKWLGVANNAILLTAFEY